MKKTNVCFAFVTNDQIDHQSFSFFFFVMIINLFASVFLQQKVFVSFLEATHGEDLGFVIEEEQEAQSLVCCKICNVHISVLLCGSTLLLCRYNRCIVSKPVIFT